MKFNQYKISSQVWLYPGMAGWHFVSIPEETSEDIKKQFMHLKRGWGSLPVIVTLGKSKWETSIFPDKKTNSYFLPLKAEVRNKEGIKADQKISLIVEIKH